ncbi:MAG: hypothetical protein DRP13_00805 [Candidatus Aenigmatarchaeota archaeon]|nr:MAG: hypothetical protein DRP13_00805 [Candidatus Aenigmarchaeota archaeon]
MRVWKPMLAGKKTYKMFINGKWVNAKDKKTFDVYNPYDGSLVGKVPRAGKEDVEKAVNAAFDAKHKIAGTDAIERVELLKRISNLLEKHKDDFIDILIKEAGKPRAYAEGEVKATIERLAVTAEEIKTMRGEYIPGDQAPGTSNRFAIVTRKPVGVVLAVSPFNYPLFISIAKIAPALAAGNSVVCKAASDDPICMLMFARVAELAGVPKGVLNVITGGGGEIGDFLVSHPKVDMISFTGSTFVGKRIAQVAGMKKMHLELGGKSPALVLEDADLDLAVKECLSGALKFSGQRCDALSRILVVEKVANEFVKKAVKEIKKWKMGNPKDKKTLIGPLINEKAINKVDSLVKDAVNKGAKVLAGGKRKGLFYEPTILDKVTLKMDIAWKETFGPVVTIIRVKNWKDAVKVANQSAYGLDASVFTQDMDKAIKTAKLLQDGSVTINGHPAHGLGLFPFGGDKDSGIGREGISYSIEEMTKLHTIVFNLKKE